MTLQPSLFSGEMEKKEFDTLVMWYFVALIFGIVISVVGFPYSTAGVYVLLAGVAGAIVLSVMNPHEDVMEST